VNPLPKQSEKVLKTVRVNDEQVEALLNRVGSSTYSPGAERRHKERYDYRTQTIVHIQQPGDSHFASYIVPTRNLSEGGTSFLFGGFVHTGTSCIIQLTTPDGIWCEVTGKVVGCRYLEGTIHEVMVRFDKPIDPSAYCMNAPCGRVLLAEDDPAAARLATFYLKGLNIRVELVTDGQEVLDQAQKREYDIILMEMELSQVDGFQVAETLRNNGYVGKIVAMMVSNQPEDRCRCLEAGCDYYLPKPYICEDLANLLTFLRDKPVYSAYFDNASMSNIISEFVSELPLRVRSIQEALLKEDAIGLLTQIRDLKGVGLGYGFAAISDIAAEAESHLMANDMIDHAREVIDRLVKLCNQVRPNPQIGGVYPMGKSKSID